MSREFMAVVGITPFTRRKHKFRPHHSQKDICATCYQPKGDSVHR